MQPAQAKTIGAVVITAIILIGIYFFVLQSKPQDTATSTAPTSAKSTKPTNDSASDPASNGTATTATPKDGTYSAKASYVVPKGWTNTIDIGTTISNGKITALTFSSDAHEEESLFNTGNFKAAINGVVIGKTLDEAATINRVGGASLTTQAFKEAIRNIADQAT